MAYQEEKQCSWSIEEVLSQAYRKVAHTMLQWQSQIQICRKRPYALRVRKSEEKIQKKINK